MKYHIITFGCQMNISDSERIASTLEKSGFKKSDKNDADLIVFNMCSVRQSAVDRIIGNINKFKDKTTILTGCILKKDKVKFRKYFDHVLDISELSKWPMTLKKQCNYLKIKPVYSSKFTASVPIMTGCNNFCSYCVVPHVRGREVSRSQKDIINEVKSLVKKDYKEIWLLGQNVNSYKDFPKLLKEVNDIPGNFWIRFTSSHPKDFSNKLIKIMSQCDKITPYLNLPAQSGDNAVLKNMNRHYKIKNYEKIIGRVRKEVPNITISTDVIVGFPGETKDQFNNTAKLFKEIKYDMAYISRYSPRPNTIAFNLEDDVSQKEKARREKVLTEILKKTALENNKKLVGKELTVLISHKNKGKTESYKTIKIETNKDLTGQFIKAKITKAFPWGLKGELKKKLIVITGPNASGKTSLSIKLAKKFNCEIISADSRQVYKEMDIGTGKVTKKEMEGIPHHLLDVVSPNTIFTVSQYKKKTQKAIKEIFEKNKVPMIVGGTGFYIQAVIDNLNIPEVKPDWTLRKKLNKKTSKHLFEILKKLDSNRAKNIDKNNKRRLIRAIEIVKKTKRPVPAFKTSNPDFDVLILGVKRNQLKERIHTRLIQRMKEGMIDEVKKIKKSGTTYKRLEELGLEYRYIALYLQNKLNYNEMIEKLQKEIEHYAKRQMTWFKKDKRINWISDYKKAENLISTFL